MSDPAQLLDITLKQHGSSLTLPRQIVFKALHNTPPLTMAELLRRCLSVDRVSVYRTIDLFERLHIVQRLQIGWKYKLELSGSFAPHHHHASCEKCGSVLPLDENSVIEKQLKLLAQSLKFDMHDHQVEIRGLCKQCLTTI